MSKLYFRYGAMNCGKTTALLQVAHNYEERGQHVIVIKPKVDKKGKNYIVSRLGAKRKVDILLDVVDHPITHIKEFLTNHINCILVDEAQFLKKFQVDELYMIARLFDIPVICYGLRTNFRMKFFEGSGPLMEMADKIEEIKTICECGKKATVNMRMISGVPVTTGPDILIGGNDSYKAVCRKCYKRLTHHVAGI